MRPLLPQHDPDVTDRLRRLARARDQVVFDYAWPPLVAGVNRLQASDRFPLRYLGHIEAVELDLARNHAAMGWSEGRLREAVRDLWEGFRLANPRSRVFAGAVEAADRAPTHKPDRDRGYLSYFASFEAPPLVRRLQERPQDWDLLFAWQRVAGANPMELRRVVELPEKLAVDAALFARATGGSDRLDAALAEGRLYLCDYAVLDGALAGMHLARRKWLAAPIALFVVDRQSRHLLPVAIQCHQQATDEHPVFTPQDGWRWRMAQTLVQTADITVHEAIRHLAETHLLMETICVAARRRLDELHPLRRLVEAHIEGTLAINAAARAELVAPGGIVATLFGPTITDTADAVRAGLERFVLQDAAPDRALAARGVDDATLLPHFPYRDDILSIWGPVRAFADDFVGVYYPDDATVLQDTELQGFLSELGDPLGGRLQGMRPVENRDDLEELVAIVVMTATAQHAALNFAQWPYMSVVESMPAATWGPGPDASTPDQEEHWRQMLPPWDAALLQSDIAFQLSGVRINRLGDYDAAHFDDPRLARVYGNLQRNLRAASLAIEGRERSGARLLPYPFLLPANIPASIHI